jgi:hypothetical protein
MGSESCFPGRVIPQIPLVSLRSGRLPKPSYTFVCQASNNQTDAYEGPSEAGPGVSAFGPVSKSSYFLGDPPPDPRFLASLGALSLVEHDHCSAVDPY